MNRSLILPLAALALCCACDSGPIKTAEYKTYLQFSQAYSSGKCDKLRELSEGAARSGVDEFCNPGPSMTVFGTTSQTPSAASMVYDMASTPSGVSRRFSHVIESKKKDGNAVVLTVVESVSVGFSRSGNPPVRSKQVVRLVKSGGQWKVSEYTDTQLP